MTRKLLLTAAIVALALGPSLGTGTARAHGFYGGYRRGFYCTGLYQRVTLDQGAMRAEKDDVVPPCRLLSD